MLHWYNIAIISSLSLLCMIELSLLPSSTRIQNILCNTNSTASKSSTTYYYQHGNEGENASSSTSSSSSWVVPYYDFPSVEERFRYYMGSWYNITDYTISDCSILIEGGTRSRDQFFNKDFIFHIDTFKSCSNHSDQGIRMYCISAYNTLSHGVNGRDGIEPKTYFEDYVWYELPALVQAAATALGYSPQLWDSGGEPLSLSEELYWEELTEDQRRAATILGYSEQSWNDDRSQDTTDDDEDMLLGDIAAVFNLGDHTVVQNPKSLPVITKARRAISELNSIAKSSQQQIIWPLNTFRHYHQLEKYHANIKDEIPWEDKLSTIVWRGKPTGSPHPSDSERSRVQLIQRWIHYNPNIVDIAFSSIAPQIIGYQSEYMKKHSIRKTMKIENMTRYKYLLSVEGNDVATGLKWMLYSNSVVMMAPPTKASWAMEDLLLPFVHYIPLSNDYSNLIEMWKWAEEHQEACKEISARATEFIERLWLSEQARVDNEILKVKLATAYVKQFSKPLAQCRRDVDDK